tara:strand:- start:425 stop:586 length:162 start_codon:yes stop_codon:yes gene_type:complete
METAVGKYLVTIDEDCFLLPNIINNFVRIFEENNNLAAIGCGFVNPNDNLILE